MRPPLFAGEFFEDQDSVDQFVSSYDAGSHTPEVQYIPRGIVIGLTTFF